MSVLKRYNDVTGLWEPVVVGKQGPSGVVNVTAPITNTGTQTDANIGIDESAITVAQSQVTDLVSDLADKADNADFTGGTAGYTALSNGTAGLSYQPVSHNYVINGAFDIWQRGTSIAYSGSGSQYSADRWVGNRAGGASGATISRQDSGLTGFEYAARVQRDSADSNTGLIKLYCSLESSMSLPLAGQDVSLSFYARKGSDFSATSDLIKAEVQSGTGTDESVVAGFTGASNVISQDVTLTTSWQRFTYTGTVSSSATQLGIRFYSIPTGTAGANDYFEITGVQLEAGSIATPFKRNANSIQGELAACQRYYYRFTNGNSSTSFAGFSRNTSSFRQMLRYPVEMRANATVAFTATTDFEIQQGVGNFAVTSTSVFEQRSQSVQAVFNSSGLTTGQAGVVQIKAGYIEADAEL